MQEVSLLETTDSGDAIIANVMHDKLFESVTRCGRLLYDRYAFIDEQHNYSDH